MLTVLQRCFPYLIICIIGFILYVKVLFFGLTYLDDNVWLLDYGWFFKDLSNAVSFFTKSDFISGAFYRPILNFSFMMDAQIGGEKPFIYHLTNIIVHLFNSCLVFHLFNRLGYERKVTLSFALIFLTHPVFAQAIAWIPGRTDSLLGSFVFLSFIAFINWLDKGKITNFGLHVLFLIGALLVKETAISLPVVCMLYAWLIKGRTVSSQKWQIVLWALVLGVWYFIRSSIISPTSHVSLITAASSIFSNLPAVISYVGKIILPVNLSVLPILKDTNFIYGIVSVIILTFGVVLSKHKRNNYLIFGLVWFLVFLLPSLIISFLTHEYRVYVPMIGFMMIILEMDIIRLLKQSQRRWVAASVVIIGIFFITTWNYSYQYKDRLTFWRNAVNTWPRSPLAQRNLGAMYFLTNQWDMAEIQFQKALALNPSEKMAHNNLGLIYMNQERFQEAEAQYLAEIKINPTYDTVYFNLGVLYYKVNQWDKAEMLWKKTIELNYKYIDAYKNLIVLYVNSGRMKEAAFYIARVIEKGVVLPEQYVDIMRQYQ